MGGGHKNTGDTPKAAPTATPAEVAAAHEPDAPDYEPCEQEHAHAFRLTDPNLARGSAVSVTLGNPPQVLVNGRAVGELERAAAIFVRGCMESGYVISGVVAAVDVPSRTGTAVLSGTRR